ncbi:hypothetical protein STENM327S_07570 [Streptomyces tendae]
MTSSLLTHGDRKSPSPPSPPSRQRDAFFDNAKYLAIVLVGVGHAWGQILDGNRTVETLYRVLYTFHMPAFIVISGYFSRSFDLSPKRVKRLITGVAVPYLVFEVAYTLHRRVSEDPQSDFSLLDPTYLLWFLCALFVWRLTTPIWQTVRWPLPISLAIAALASVTPSVGNDLNMQRVLQFLPCFVLGLVLRPEHFRMVRRRSVRILSVPVVAAALVIAWWSVPRMETGWFYRNAAMQDTGAPWWSGPVLTLALFGCSVVLTACFFAWVPGRRMCVHGTRRRHDLRLPAARLPGEGGQLHRLVPTPVPGPAARRDRAHRPRRRRRHPAVHQARPAGPAVRGRTEDGMGVQAGSR